MKMFYISDTGLLPSMSEVITIPDRDLAISYDLYGQHVKIYDGVALIKVSGVLVPEKPWFIDEYSCEGLRALISFALDDVSVKEIVLGFDSPGGRVAGTQETAEFIKQSSEKKKITACVYGSAASGAYWLASACSEIVVNESSEVGSIGAVFAVWKSQDETIEFVSKYAPNKRVDPSSKNGKEEFQRRVDELGDIFLSSVAVNRGMTTEEVVQAGHEGGMVSGRLAVEVGLADRVGTLEELLHKNETTSTKSEDTRMDVKTLEKEHPDVYAQVFALGAQAEQSRQAEIRELSVPGFESIIEEGLGKITMSAATVSVAIIKAQKEHGTKGMEALVNGSVQPIVGADTSIEEDAPASALEDLVAKAADARIKGGAR